MSDTKTPSFWGACGNTWAHIFVPLLILGTIGFVLFLTFDLGKKEGKKEERQDGGNRYSRGWDAGYEYGLKQWRKDCQEKKPCWLNRQEFLDRWKDKDKIPCVTYDGKKTAEMKESNVQLWLRVGREESAKRGRVIMDYEHPLYRQFVQYDLFSH